LLSRRSSSRFRAASLLLATAITLIVLVSATGARAQTNSLAQTMVVTDANGHVLSGSDEVSVGQSLTVTAAGWLANNDVTRSFYCGAGDPVGLGTFSADDAGVLRRDFIVPDAGSGDCTPRLTGVGSDGNARSIEAAIGVKGTVLSIGGVAFQRGEAPREAAGGAGVFGKTGATVWPLAHAGVSLLAVGAVLFLAVRRYSVDYAPVR
jgi:hypothetical protein